MLESRTNVYLPFLEHNPNTPVKCHKVHLYQLGRNKDAGLHRPNPTTMVPKFSWCGGSIRVGGRWAGWARDQPLAGRLYPNASPGQAGFTMASSDLC